METLSITDIPILSEESTSMTHYSGSGPLWIVDPLDGTRNFLNQSDDFSVMIGLVLDDAPVLSVVYAPKTGQLFTASLGKGAFRHDGEHTVELRASDNPVNRSRFICSANHFEPIMEHIASELQIPHKIPRGSVGIKASVIAAGEGEFYFTPGKLGVWDVAAPALIATEAGCNVTDLHGNPLTYTSTDCCIEHGVLISNDACYDTLLETIRAYQGA